MSPGNGGNLTIGCAQGTSERSTTGHHLPVLVGRLTIKDEDPVTKGLIHESVQSSRQGASSFTGRQDLDAVARRCVRWIGTPPRIRIDARSTRQLLGGP